MSYGWTHGDFHGSRNSAAHPTPRSGRRSLAAVRSRQRRHALPRNDPRCNDRGEPIAEPRVEDAIAQIERRRAPHLQSRSHCGSDHSLLSASEDTVASRQPEDPGSRARRPRFLYPNEYQHVWLEQHVGAPPLPDEVCDCLRVERPRSIFVFENREPQFVAEAVGFRCLSRNARIS